MALYGLNDQTDAVNEVKENINKNPSYNVDTPMENIIKQISGYRWFVDYYNLVTNSYDNQSTVDFSLDLAVTEYNLIKDMVLILDSPIDNDTAINVGGSGYIDSNIIPKNGDVFIAKLMDGRLGLFYLSGVSRDTYNLRDVFKVSFKLYSIIKDENETDYVKLQDKVIETYYFNKDYLKTNDKKLFTSKEVLDRDKVDALTNTLLTVYNSKIINTDVRYTISYKDSLNRILHDPHLEDFVSKVIGSTSLHRNTNMFSKKDTNKYTILDVLAESLDSKLIYKYFSINTASKLGVNPFLRPVVYGGVDMLIIPEKELSSTLEPLIQDNDLYPYVSNIYYIFPEDFYSVLNGDKIITDVNNISSLEKIVLSIINKETIKLVDVEDIVDDLLINGEEPELYYYIPILIYVLRYYKNNYNVASI